MKKTFFIAGVQFRPHIETREAVKKMKPGDVLLLEPEPTNKFDPNAIKIIFKETFEADNLTGEESTFLGYIPKKFSSEISGLLGIDVELKCTVEEVNASASPWEMIKVTISDEEDINTDFQGPESER